MIESSRRRMSRWRLIDPFNPIEAAGLPVSATSVMRQRLYIWQNAAKARLYYTLRRCLSQNRRDRMKKWQSAARRRMGRLFSILYGSFGAKELVGSLETRIKDEFDILMVHSSYDNLLPMYSGTP